jgi:hypothetical protein
MDGALVSAGSLLALSYVNRHLRLECDNDIF